MSTSVVASASTSADGAIWTISGASAATRADAGEADRGDIEEVAAANAVAPDSAAVGTLSGLCLGGHHSPFDACCFGAGIGTLATPRRTDVRRDWRA